MSGELDLLARAHALFTDPIYQPTLTSAALHPQSLQSEAVFTAAYREAAAAQRMTGTEAGRADTALVRILDDARRDHAEGRRGTAAVLAAARADSAVPDNPIAARELLHRRAIRLRNQRRHVLAARRRARRRRAALLALRYGVRSQRVRSQRGGPRSARAAAAVRAALTRLGSPYVWGAVGPHRFDCSGLVKWAYAQAGVPVRRTTYEQILDGVPVGRSQVRPGDLVFPHTGHVQMAIGNNLVIEAPYSGATVRISPLGPAVAIRRPL